MEDSQGYLSLIRYLTKEPVDNWDQLADLKSRLVLWCADGCGNGSGFSSFSEQVNLRVQTQSYRWCFILFQATFGRDDIAAQINELLDEGQKLDRLVLVNYHLDHSNAKDDLRRLFAMIPTVQLYFPDAQHLFEIDAGSYINPRGAAQMAKLFEHLRKGGLPLFVVGYREFRRSLEALGLQDDPNAVTSAVRRRLVDATDVLFELMVRWLPPKQEFWDRVDSAFNAFLAEEGKSK